MRISNLLSLVCLGIATAHSPRQPRRSIVTKSANLSPTKSSAITTADACTPSSTQVIVNGGFEDENGGEDLNGGTYEPNFPPWSISSMDAAYWERADYVLPGFVGNPYKGNYGFAANSQAPGGTVTLSQTICVVSNQPYNLSGYLGYFGSGTANAPVVDVLLDGQTVLKSISVCTCQPVGDIESAGCADDQVPDTYCQFTATATPTSSQPVLTFNFYFDNSETATYEGDLDEVTFTLSG